jgi:cell division protein FtsQ
MEIRTSRPREAQSAKDSPAPEKPRRARKKTVQKVGKGTIAARRLLSAAKIMSKIAVVLLMALFLLSIFVYAFNSDRFKLHVITFYGCKQTQPKQLEKIIRKDFPANILRIDLYQLQMRLEKEPWIRKAEIRRILPSDLAIYIQERSPAVILELNGELMLADSDGTLLDAYDPRYGKLDTPVIKGFIGKDAESYRRNHEENAARLQQVLDMFAEIEAGLPSHTQKISEVDISDPNNLKILLVDDSAEILLGDKDYLKSFRKLIDYWDAYQEQKSQHSDIVAVDLRIPGRIVYQTRERATN